MIQREREIEEGRLSKRLVASKWSDAMIKEILDNDFYIGTFRLKKRARNTVHGKDKRVPKEEQCIFENHHPAIIDKATFSLVQELKEKRNRTNYRGSRGQWLGSEIPHPFGSCLYCKDCGSRLTPIKRQTSSRERKYYICTTYNTKGRRYCSKAHLIEEDDFDLTKAADIISQDTALIISLLRLANTRSFNSEITSVRVAVSMLGQKDLTRWIQTTVIEKLCSDKPNELMRLSLLRAKFAENLAPVFGMAMRSQELFLTGLFSILDIILDCSMEEALSMVRVSGKIRAALLERTGSLAEVLHFIVKYESAEWQEVSRQLVLKNIEIPDVSHAWVSSLQWYAKLIAMNE